MPSRLGGYVGQVLWYGSVIGNGKPGCSRSGKDGVEQHLRVGGIAFAQATVQVVVGRAQREEPVAGFHHPLDEGPDSGQGLVVGPSGEPAFAKVITNEAQPVLGQFAGRICVEGRGRGARGRLFHSS